MKKLEGWVTAPQGFIAAGVKAGELGQQAGELLDKARGKSGDDEKK